MQSAWKAILLLSLLLTSPAIAGSSIKNHPLLKSEKWVSHIASVRSLDPSEQDAVIIGVRGYFNSALEKTITANKASDTWYLKTHSIGFCTMAHLANEAASYELLDYFEAECIASTQLIHGEITEQEYDAKQEEIVSLLANFFDRIEVHDMQGRMAKHRHLVNSIGRHILGYSKFVASE